MSALVRLSRFLVFVPYGDEVEVQHTVRGTVERIGRSEHARLLGYRGFREVEPEDASRIECGWLVGPGRDSAEHHGGLRPDTEARLDRDYLDWYWAREVESERELRWMGVVVLKMPTDLFVYQALMTEHGIRSVLEIGSGDGGGLWFFASVLAMLGGGEVVGVEREPGVELPFSRWAGVEVRVQVGDAADEGVFRGVERPGGYGMVVIDVGRRPGWALGRWARAVAEGGFLVIEDIEEWDEIDAFLVEHREFGIEAVGLPMRKGLVVRRGPAEFERGARPSPAIESAGQ